METFISTFATARKIILAGLLFFPVLLMAENWPKEIQTAKSTVIMYQPQPDSLKRDHLYSRAAISITTPNNPTPVFGAVWTDSRFSTDRESGICTIFDVNILNVRFPGIDTIDPAKIQKFTSLLEEEATSWKVEFSLDELKSSLALNQVAVRKSADFKNDPPEIIFQKQNSVLVSFDGDPVFNEIENSGLKRAVNTPFLVLQDMQDRYFYLYGSDNWYRTTDPVKYSWAFIQRPSSNVSRYYDEMQKQTDKTEDLTQTTEVYQAGIKKSGIPRIVVSTRPAELIQSQGEPRFAPIQGTQLLYMTNTDDNIFMTINDNQYYVLISGRWYSSPALDGSWSYIDADNLPEDFARIPEGSEKDIVLASVAGTDAARDAVMDAQIPQTAAVDRKTARCDVSYDGDPKFERIKGTDLARGLNTASMVLLYRNTYYVCDNAVWFVGPGPAGPWEVATSLPDEIQRIPPDDPAYNVKYVYIYDVQPDVVYIGYTPGYTGCYVYGPTVVYGTGWNYHPFYEHYYYPRPRTYGFCMHYNPWFGWSMGYSMSVGWFHYNHGNHWGHHGGWWGPSVYRPPYHPPYNHYYGSRRPTYRGGHNAINTGNNRSNIYSRRGDGSARPGGQSFRNPRPGAGDRNFNRPPAGNDRSRPGFNQNSRESKPPIRTTGQKNNVFTDRKGDVYRNENGNWQQHNGRNWESVQQQRNGQQKPPERIAPTGQQDRNRQQLPPERIAPASQQERNGQQKPPERIAPTGQQERNGQQKPPERIAPTGQQERIWQQKPPERIAPTGQQERNGQQ
ncbi:MAG: hypothetical protein WCK34_13965, partial [Bacteroidota bacterium]